MPSRRVVGRGSDGGMVAGVNEEDPDTQRAARRLAYVLDAAKVLFAEMMPRQLEPELMAERRKLAIEQAGLLFDETEASALPSAIPSREANAASNAAYERTVGRSYTISLQSPVTAEIELAGYIFEEAAQPEPEPEPSDEDLARVTSVLSDRRPFTDEEEGEP